MVELVGDGDAQGVQPTGLLVARVSEVVVDFEMAVGGRAGCPRIGKPVKTPTDSQFDNVNVVFVATAQAVVRRRWIVAELLDF